MGKFKIAIPEGTVRHKITYLMDNHPELSRGEMASILGKSIQSVYAYVSEIKKSRARAEAKKADLEKRALQVFEKPPELQQAELQQAEAIEFMNETTPAPVPAPSPTHAPASQPVEQVLLDKAPETLELSLAGINGAHLQKLLFELLNNSVSGDAKYSFKFSLERTK